VTGFLGCIEAFSTWLWGTPMIAILAITGVFLSFRLRFLQVRYISYIFKQTLGKVFSKEKLGKVVCIAGLYPVALLKNGTKGECLKKAQELIEILAPGAGYIFGLDKSIMKSSDINPENLKAVTQFIIREGKY